MIISPLKIAILESGFKQKFVAQRAGLTENRLACAVIGRLELTPDEQKRVAKILAKPISKLFPEKTDDDRD